MRKEISVIIPVHNEEKRLSYCLEQIIPYLHKYFTYCHEIIIVDNASTDGTPKIMDVYKHTYSNIYGLTIPMRGKGAAVRQGMLFSDARWRYMCDVDLSTPIDTLRGFVNAAESAHADVVIGSRELIRAGVRTTFARRMIGRAFHLLVNDLVPGVLDTQCGFKLFSSIAANGIFSRLKLPGMAFDVEALYLARMLGLRVYEMPVRWEHNADSRVRFVWDSLEMARDVISIPWMHTQISADPVVYKS